MHIHIQDTKLTPASTIIASQIDQPAAITDRVKPQNNLMLVTTYPGTSHYQDRATPRSFHVVGILCFHHLLYSHYLQSNYPVPFLLKYLQRNYHVLYLLKYLQCNYPVLSLLKYLRCNYLVLSLLRHLQYNYLVLFLIRYLCVHQHPVEGVNILQKLGGRTQCHEYNIESYGEIVLLSQVVLLA